MKNKIYFSYQTRLRANIVMLVLTSVISILLLAHSFNLFEKTKITYKENNEIHYTVQLKENNLLGRRYFYPLISEFTTYKGLESSRKENLPIAHKLADSVICLPMYADLTDEDVERIIEVVRK